ncbi:MAG: hypothetical protein QOD91_2220, partial [Frankiales bacterium]|nr:hypothetical protein [Frankiales bacterium]
YTVVAPMPESSTVVTVQEGANVSAS